MTENKLRIKDLMIGDWLLAVDREGDDESGGVKEHTYPIQVKECLNIDTFIDHHGCVRDAGSIRELSITNELLKKNGFRYVDQDCVQFWRWDNVDIDAYDHTVNIHNKGRRFYGKIKALHELQHVFRDCRIETELIV